MRAIIALAQKDLLVLVRDKGGLFSTLVFPFLIALFFGVIFSGDGDHDSAMSILLIDEDQTASSVAFIETLRGAAELHVELSERSDAEAQVRRGRKVAYIVLKKGFGAAREQVFLGDAPEVELGVDPARRAEAGMLTGILMHHASQHLQAVFHDPENLRRQVRTALELVDATLEGDSSLRRFLVEFERLTADSAAAAFMGIGGFNPLSIEEAAVIRERGGPPNGYAISFPQGVIWGIIGCAAAFAISFVVERSGGTLVRIRVAPISHAQILAGKGVACFVAIITVSMILLAVARFGFDVRPNSIPLLGLGIVSISLGFVGIMMFLSVLGKSEQAASGIAMAVLLIMALLGGGMIPLFVMPRWMQIVSHVSPIKWAVLAVEGPIWRGFGMQEMLLPISILIGIGVVFFVMGVRMLRWTQDG